MFTRDEAALAAMQGLMSRTDPAGFNFALHPHDALRVACWAYDAADAMLRVGSAKSDAEIRALYKEVSDVNKKLACPTHKK